MILDYLGGPSLPSQMSFTKETEGACPQEREDGAPVEWRSG